MRTLKVVCLFVLPAAICAQDWTSREAEIFPIISTNARAQQESAPAWTVDSLAAPPEVRLEALSEETVQELRKHLGSNWAGPHRELPASAYSEPGATDGRTLGSLRGNWDFTAAGRAVWQVSIRSPGARSISVHFDGFEVDGEVWVHATGVPGASHWVGPYRGRGLHGDGEFWSESVFAEAVTISYFPRDGADAIGALPFVVQEISHVIGEMIGPYSAPKLDFGPLSPRMVQEPRAEPRQAAACNVDISCDPTWSERWDDPAIAFLLTQKRTGTYQCSGTLVNVDLPSDDFGLLTAGHCVGNSRDARNTTFYWGYKTDSCNGPAPNLSDVPRTLGSALVARRLGGWFGDFALLRLDRAEVLAETGVTALGWTSDPVYQGSDVVGISHPDGEPQRVSFGYSTEPAFYGRNPATYLTVAWNEGTTEPGSSGSGLFLTDGKFVGVLSGGSAQVSPCDPAFRNTYHRFSDIYGKIERHLK